jgi:hypothetical protein
MCLLNLNNEKVVESETDEDVEDETEIEDETIERDAMNLLKKQNKKLIIGEKSPLFFTNLLYPYVKKMS